MNGVQPLIDGWILVRGLVEGVSKRADEILSDISEDTSYKQYRERIIRQLPAIYKIWDSTVSRDGWKAAFRPKLGPFSLVIRLEGFGVRLYFSFAPITAQVLPSAEKALLGGEKKIKEASSDQLLRGRLTIWLVACAVLLFEHGEQQLSEKIFHGVFGNNWPHFQ